MTARSAPASLRDHDFVNAVTVVQTKPKLNGAVACFAKHYRLCSQGISELYHMNVANRLRGKSRPVEPSVTGENNRSRTTGSGGIAVMAKASAPGRTKTRLVPPLTFEQAAALNTAFLRDVAGNLLWAGASCPDCGLRCFRASRDRGVFPPHDAA